MASRERFRAGGLSLHERLLDSSPQGLDAIVDAENRLGDEARAQLRAIAERGVELGRAAVAAEPDRAEGHLYLAGNYGLLGLTQSHAASILEGLPGKIKEHCDRAIALDPEADAAGALRIKGKFLASAPWPFGDNNKAVDALQRAQGIARLRQNYLFLGDLYFAQGRRGEAVAAWRAAATTPSHPATASIDDQVRRLAQRRLEATE